MRPPVLLSTLLALFFIPKYMLAAPFEKINFGCGPFDSTLLVEFHNTTLDHYFYTTACSGGELEFVDSGGAGSGWLRTGWTMVVRPPFALNVRPMARFYGSLNPGPNSHFFTDSESEAAALVALAARTPSNLPRWNAERVTFAVGQNNSPTGTCEPAILRFYNKGFERGKDSNHRFVYAGATSVQTQLIAAGWVKEGFAFCAGGVALNGVEQ
jgi:hypothetical protein